MYDPSAAEFCDADFSGQARLFPLPNLVMFPNVIQPLHIFEERYREMMRDALAGDELLAMCLLAPGWEKSRSDRPEIYAGACLGRIVSWRQLDDGRYNLLLAGMRRIKIVSEIDNGLNFREARVEICPETSDVSDLRREELRRRLACSFKQALAQTAVGDQSHDLLKLFESPITLPALTDILAYSLELPLDFKQQLLEETCSDARALTLLRHLDEARKCGSNGERKFPPDFSTN